MPQVQQLRLIPFAKLKLSCCRKRHSYKLLEQSLDRHAFLTQLDLRIERLRTELMYACTAVSFRIQQCSKSS